MIKSSPFVATCCSERYTGKSSSPRRSRGRRRPLPVEESNFTLDADVVVIAVGEQPEIKTITEKITAGRDNTILVNPFSMETSMPGVFAAGDGVSGPLTVADAILGAKRAAIGIDTNINSL